MFRKIVFHGGLADTFGDGYELDILSPAEAIRALSWQLEGFEAYIKRGNWKIITKKDGRKDREQTLELLSMTQFGDIHIIPVIGGEGGKSGLGKILLGVAIVGVAFAVPAALGVAMGSSIFSVGGFSLTYGQMAGIGFAMALSGVAQLLGPHNKKAKQSYLFSGTLNNTDEGGVVPVWFGECFAGTVVISGGISTDAIVGTSTVPGGGGGGPGGPLTDDIDIVITDDSDISLTDDRG